MNKKPLDTALKGLSKVENLDKTCVPLKPTKNMLDLGASVGGVDLETARDIYQVMVQAYILSPEEE